MLLFCPISFTGIRSAASTYRTLVDACTGQNRAGLYPHPPRRSHRHLIVLVSRPKQKRPSAFHLPAWQLPSNFTEAATEMRCSQMEGERARNAGRPPEVTGDPLRGFSRGTHTSPMRSLACSDQGVLSLAATKGRSGGHTGIRSEKQAIGKSHLALFGTWGACQEREAGKEQWLPFSKWREGYFQQAHWSCGKVDASISMAGVGIFRAERLLGLHMSI